MKRFFQVLAAVFFAASFSTTGALALSEPGRDPGANDRGEKKERIQGRIAEIRMEKLTQLLVLDEDRAMRLSDVLNKYDKERMVLRKEHRGFRREMMDVMGPPPGQRPERGGEYGEEGRRDMMKPPPIDIDDKTAASLVKRMRDNRSAMHSITERQETELDAILTPSQMLKYMGFASRFEREIRERISGQRRGDGDGRRRGGDVTRRPDGPR